MSHVSIEFIIPQCQAGPQCPAEGPTVGEPAVYDGFTVLGVTERASENVQVYYEIPANGVMSANLPTISDEQGKWRAVFHGKFRPGTEVTAYARNGTAALAQITKVL